MLAIYCIGGVMKITKEKITDLVLEEIKAELRESSYNYAQLFESIRQVKSVLRGMLKSDQSIPMGDAQAIAREAKDIQRIAMELAGGMARE